MAPATMSYYTDKVAALEKILLTVRGETLVLSDGALLEAQILAYLDHLFLLGLSVSSGEKVVPALAAVHTQSGSILKSRHRIQRALRGWRRLRPPISRLPFNWPTICEWLATVRCKEASIQCTGWSKNPNTRRIYKNFNAIFHLNCTGTCSEPQGHKGINSDEAFKIILRSRCNRLP